MRRAALLLLPLLLIAGCGGSGSSPSTSQPNTEESASGQSGAVAPESPLEGTVADPSFAPWPGFARSARHSGGAAAIGPQSAHVRWRRSLEGAVVPGPAVGDDGVVYAASNGGVLHAIDLESGNDRWRFDGGGTYGSDLSTTPALLRDGTVVWPGPRDTLFALSPEGKLLWEVGLAAQPLSPALTPDGSIVVGDTAGTLEELTLHGAARPTPKWRLRLDGSSYSSPAVGPDGSVYTTSGDSLVAVRDGKELWRYASGSESEVSPAIALDGTVVFGSNDQYEYGVSPAGKLRWRYRIDTRTYSSPVITHDGLAYFGDNHGVLSTLDARSGALVSRVSGLEKPPGIWTAPAVDAHHDVYFGSSNHIFGFDQEGKRLLDVETGGTVDSYPALAADGTLLIGSEDGFLYAIGS